MRKDITFKEFKTKVKPINTFVIIFISLIIGICIRMFLFEVVQVDGLSMYPTYSNEQHLGILKNFYDIEHGDIVIFNSHDSQDNVYVKRVIGLPNDHLQIKDNRIYINDKIIKEDYLSKFVVTEGDIDITIPENEYFVLGDNRTQSKDSRIIGTIKKEDIKGEVLFKMW